MICKNCSKKNHRKCDNHKHENLIPIAATVMNHCACQHKVSWNFVEKIEGNNGDGKKS